MNIGIEAYNKSVETKNLREVCDFLAKEISSVLPESAESKIFYAMPAWLIDNNPVVAYNVTKKSKVNLLFWSGQSFKEPGLTPEGKFKAAEIKYENPEEIDKEKLKKWLKESSQVMWNYRDIRQNKGKLSLL